MRTHSTTVTGVPRTASLQVHALLILSLVTLILLAWLISGCTEQNPVLPGEDSQSVSEAGSEIPVSWEDTRCPRFKLNAKYSYIRSLPGGGGVFIVKLDAGDDFSGSVRLSLAADAALGARLDRTTLNKEDNIAEITVRPGSDVASGMHQIAVRATPPSSCRVISPDMSRTIYLDVEIIPWGEPDPRYAEPKREILEQWLAQEYPEYGSILDQDWFAYLTYPGILVVEHWTFLSDEWEMRFCFHVMIPPHDWSMMMIRKRGNWEPEIAIMREHDGTAYVIHEMPIDDYPAFYGY